MNAIRQTVHLNSATQERRFHTIRASSGAERVWKQDTN